MLSSYPVSPLTMTRSAQDDSVRYETSHVPRHCKVQTRNMPATLRRKPTCPDPARGMQHLTHAPPPELTSPDHTTFYLAPQAATDFEPSWTPAGTAPAHTSTHGLLPRGRRAAGGRAGANRSRFNSAQLAPCTRVPTRSLTAARSHPD